jgi:single-strand DNA-binding protein
MNTFIREGNIGSAPEFKEFPKGNDEPDRLLRLNVYFDNRVPTKDGYEDRGGFWAPVELWHPKADVWSKLFQQGMRVLVVGHVVLDKWEHPEKGEQKTFKIRARRVAILPYRIESVTMEAKANADEEEELPY